MDLLTFTAEIFKAVAWPAVAVAIVLIFRPQLRALTARLSRGRLGPAEFEFEFEQQLKVLAARATSAGAETRGRTASGRTAPGRTASGRTAPGRTASGPASTTALDAAMPSAAAASEAVMAAWHELEQGVRAGVQQWSAQDLALYRQLGALRDQAYHTAGFAPSAQSVSDYVALARRLRARLEGAPGDS